MLSIRPLPPDARCYDEGGSRARPQSWELETSIERKHLYSERKLLLELLTPSLTRASYSVLSGGIRWTSQILPSQRVVLRSLQLALGRSWLAGSLLKGPNSAIGTLGKGRESTWFRARAKPSLDSLTLLTLDPTLVGSHRCWRTESNCIFSITNRSPSLHDQVLL